MSGRGYLRLRAIGCVIVGMKTEKIEEPFIKVNYWKRVYPQFELIYRARFVFSFFYSKQMIPVSIA